MGCPEGRVIGENNSTALRNSALGVPRGCVNQVLYAGGSSLGVSRRCVAVAEGPASGVTTFVSFLGGVYTAVE